MTKDELLHLSTGDHVRFINDPTSDYAIISRYSERKTDGKFQENFLVTRAELLGETSTPYNMCIKSDDMLVKWEVIK